MTDEKTQETITEEAPEKPKRRRRSTTRKKPAASKAAAQTKKSSTAKAPAKEKPKRRTVASVVKDVFSEASAEVGREISASFYQRGVNSLAELRRFEPNEAQTIIRAAFYSDAVRAMKRRAAGKSLDSDTEAALRRIAELRNVNFDSLFTPPGLPELAQFLQEASGNHDFFRVLAYLAQTE